MRVAHLISAILVPPLPMMQPMSSLGTVISWVWAPPCGGPPLPAAPPPCWRVGWVERSWLPARAANAAAIRNKRQTSNFPTTSPYILLHLLINKLSGKNFFLRWVSAVIPKFLQIFLNLSTLLRNKVFAVSQLPNCSVYKLPPSTSISRTRVFGVQNPT